MHRSHRALVAGLAAAAMALPLVSAVAAPAKKKVPAKPNAKAGMVAFKTESCAGCHKTKDYPMGGEIGPNLSDVTKRKTTAQIKAYIQKPAAGSQMPAFKGPAATLNNLVAYLATQKG